MKSKIYVSFGKEFLIWLMKETKAYINVEDIEVYVNGEEPIDEEYFYDDLPVIGTGNIVDGILHIDLLCTN